jgi:hypothetical protein
MLGEKKRDVHSHLLHNGMDPAYTNWIYHGEQPDEGNISDDSDDEDDVDDGAGLCDMLNTLIRGTNMGSNADHDEGAGDIHVDDSGSEGTSQEPNATAKVFFELLKEAKKRVVPRLRGCHKAIFHCEALPNQVRDWDDQQSMRLDSPDVHADAAKGSLHSY